jgi:uncharacterized membrane protein
MVHIRRTTGFRPVRVHLSGHHKELLRTNPWLVPAIEVLAAIGLFAATNAADRAAYHGSFAGAGPGAPGPGGHRAGDHHQPTYDRLVARSFEKIRQSSRGLPAVLIRLLDGLTRIMERATAEDQRQVLLDQAAMIIQASEETVPDEPDRADVRRRYQALLAVYARLTGSPLATPGT